MSDEDKPTPHRERHVWGEIAAWRETAEGTVACERRMATKLTLEMAGGFPQFEFQLGRYPEEKSSALYRLRQLEYALDRAYDCGRESMKREFREMLGIKT